MSEYLLKGLGPWELMPAHKWPEALLNIRKSKELPPSFSAGEAMRRIYEAVGRGELTSDIPGQVAAHLVGLGFRLPIDYQPTNDTA